MSPPMLAAAGVAPLLVYLVVILSTAAVVSLVFHRLRLAAIPAYLVAGAIIGPGLLGVVPSAEHVASISQLAIVLLMFGIGLHTDTGELRGDLASIIGTAVLSCVVITALATAVALVMGESAPAALLLGAGVSMSSTAAVMRLLQQRRELRNLHARLAFGTLIVQDIYAVIVIASVPLLAAWHAAARGGDAGLEPSELLAKGAMAVAGVAAIIVVGRLLLPRVLFLAGRDGGSELVLIVGAGSALGSAAATAALGFSPELGAFLAGFVLATTPARHQLLGQLAPVRDLFVPVFFVAVGLGLDVGSALGAWWVVLLALAAVLLLKVAVVGVAAWAMGMAGPVAAMAGAILAQTGEFTLVVVGVGASRGIVSAEAAAVMGTVVGLSLMLTPSLFYAAPHLARLFVRVRPPLWRRRLVRDIGARRATAQGRDLLAIVAGFGPIGREAVNRLEQAGFTCTIIELNPETVRRQRGLGRRIVYGDVANAEVLHEAGIESADAVLLTMPDHEAMLRACQLVRSLAPTAFVAARSSYLSRGMQAAALGADYVVVDEVATATMMAEQVAARLRLRVEASAGRSTPAAS
ncbi:MAG TPA: cation:proton antiporter [Phycisphaerales bacterium]|nr:cation:proton antiporter [Phycisphaerales bacterium]